MSPERYTDVLEQHPNMPDELREHVTRLAVEAGELGLIAQSLESAHAPLWPSQGIGIQRAQNSGHHMNTSMGGTISTENVLTQEAAHESDDGSPLSDILKDIKAFANGEIEDSEASGDIGYYKWRSMIDMATEQVADAPTQAEQTDRLSRLIGGVSYLLESSHSSPDSEYDQAAECIITALESWRFADKLIPSLREIYLDGSDKTSQALRTMMTSLLGKTDRYDRVGDKYSMDLLTEIYEEDFVDLYKRAYYYADPTLFEVFTAEDAKKHIIDDALKNPELLQMYTPAQATNIQREAAQRVLREIAPNLPGTIAQDLFFAAYSRTEPKDVKDHEARAEALNDLLVKAIENTDKLGLTAVQQLHRHAGIINFDYYTAEQLEVMNKTIEYDGQTLEHLREGDLTVVFVDALGDHNGALSTVSSIYGKPSGRTLFFEIHSPEDYDKYKAFLRTRDLKPSTIVLANHGSPGYLAIGNGQRKEKSWRVVKDHEGHEVVTEVEEDRVGYAVTNEQGTLTSGEQEREKFPILSVVGDLRMYMQPSRGIDDSWKDAGYCKIILNACSQDKLVPPTTTTPEREPVTETIARAVGPDTMIVGGNKVIGLDATEKGLKMVGFERQPDGSYKELGFMPISVLRVGVDGHIVRGQVDELILRQ
ncbi:MAG TPA: hypothetical protein VLG92_03460 [Candidatus Saccharimonadia bacterium]|nr:hypothetical protein [Candidatus Saccharimonadia bacterium]